MESPASNFRHADSANSCGLHRHTMTVTVCNMSFNVDSDRLAQHSTVIADMLTSSIANPTWSLSNCDVRTFNSLLQYMQAPEQANWRDANQALQLYKLADYLHCPQLLSDLENCMLEQSQLTVLDKTRSNVLQWILAACHLPSADTHKPAWAFEVASNFDQLMQSSTVQHDFGQLPAELLGLVMNSMIDMHQCKLQAYKQVIKDLAQHIKLGKATTLADTAELYKRLSSMQSFSADSASVTGASYKYDCMQRLESLKEVWQVALQKKQLNENDQDSIQVKLPEWLVVCTPSAAQFDEYDSYLLQRLLLPEIPPFKKCAEANLSCVKHLHQVMSELSLRYKPVQNARRKAATQQLYELSSSSLAEPNMKLQAILAASQSSGAEQLQQAWQQEIASNAQDYCSCSELCELPADLLAGVVVEVSKIHALQLTEQNNVMKQLVESTTNAVVCQIHRECVQARF